MRIEMDCPKGKNVITKEGNMIGVMTGVEIETEEWDVKTIMIDVEVDMIDPLELEELLIDETRIGVPIDLIALVGDIVQLSVSSSELRGALSP
jgi:sporulation protein YlmC with PRC-barrel domain